MDKGKRPGPSTPRRPGRSELDDAQASASLRVSDQAGVWRDPPPAANVPGMALPVSETPAVTPITPQPDSAEPPQSAAVVAWERRLAAEALARERRLSLRLYAQLHAERYGSRLDVRELEDTDTVLGELDVLRTA